MNIMSIGHTTQTAEKFLRKLKASSFYENCLQEPTVILANFGEKRLPEGLQTSLASSLENNPGQTILFLENVTKDHLPQNALFAVDAKYCVILSGSGGRRQHIFLEGANENGNLPVPEQSINEVAEKEDGDKLGSPATNLNDTHITEAAAPPSTYDTMVNWVNLKSTELRSSKDFQRMNGSEMRGSVTIASTIYYDTSINSTPASIYYSYDVVLAAVVKPKRNKIIMVTSVHTYVSIPDGLTKNDSSGRGDGTYKAWLSFYPGNSYTFKKETVSLPQGWRIVKIAPETPNSENQYTRTTGWSISGTAKSNKQQPVDLTFSYSESDQYTTAFKDFTALNRSTSSYCEWNFVYTKVYQNPKSIFTGFFDSVESFPLLAKSTMYLKNEIVYEAPQDASGQQCFCTYIGQECLYAWSGTFQYGINYSNWKGKWDYFYLNLDTVKFPH